MRNLSCFYPSCLDGDEEHCKNKDFVDQWTEPITIERVPTDDLGTTVEDTSPLQDLQHPLASPKQPNDAFFEDLKTAIEDCSYFEDLEEVILERDVK